MAIAPAPSSTIAVAVEVAPEPAAVAAAVAAALMALPGAVLVVGTQRADPAAVVRLSGVHLVMHLRRIRAVRLLRGGLGGRGAALAGHVVGGRSGPSVCLAWRGTGAVGTLAAVAEAAARRVFVAALLAGLRAAENILHAAEGVVAVLLLTLGRLGGSRAPVAPHGRRTVPPGRRVRLLSVAAHVGGRSGVRVER